MTASDTRRSWMEAYSRLPWVTRLVNPRQCTGFMAHTPLKAVWGDRAGKMTEAEFERLKKKYTCKNRAYWKFEGLKLSKRFPYRTDQSGTYCWKHLVHRGVYGSMEEEDRTLKWFKKHDPEIYEIIRPKWPTDGE